MAPDHSKDSITLSLQKSESIRTVTEDFYLQAAKLVPISNPLNRYYHLKLNSLINPLSDDIRYIQRLAKRNLICIKCGIPKEFRLKTRRKQNLNKEKRLYCKYLRTICDQYCQSCQTLHNRFKLLGRREILNKRQGSDNPSIGELIDTEHKELKAKQKPKQSQSVSKLPVKQNPSKFATSNPTTAEPRLKPTRPQYQHQSKYKGKRPFPVKPKIEIVPPSKISKNQPQFSSRLRAFSCLLEE